MLIREATIKDIDQLVPILESFHKNSPYADYPPFCQNSATITFNGLILGERGQLHVAEKDGIIVGIIAFLIMPCYFNIEHYIADEMFWYVMPEHRSVGVKLYNAAIEAIKKNPNVTLMTMSAVQPWEKTTKFYERAGLKPVEQRFLGRFDGNLNNSSNSGGGRTRGSS